MHKNIEEFLRIIKQNTPPEYTRPVIRVDKINRLYIRTEREDIFLFESKKQSFLKRNGHKYDYHYDVI